MACEQSVNGERFWVYTTQYANGMEEMLHILIDREPLTPLTVVASCTHKEYLVELAELLNIGHSTKEMERIANNGKAND